MKHLAVKTISVMQEGVFGINNKKYILELAKNSTSELFNFYLDNEGAKGVLACSVYTKYNSKTVGVKKAGEYTRELYGNYEIYINYVSTLDQGRHSSGSDMQSTRKLIMNDDGIFVDVITRTSDTITHKQEILEGNILGETLKILNDNNEQTHYLEYKCIKSGTGVKVKKLKGVDYVVRESGDSDIRTIPIKTMEMIALEKDLSWLDNKDYRLLKTKEDFDEYVARLDAHKGEVGFDTETTGLRINRFPLTHPQRDNIVGICLSIADHEGVYIPLRHKLFENLDETYVIETLRPYLDTDSPKKKSLVTHYGGYDWKVMWGYGINLNIENDTYILQYMINNSQFKARKDLKSLAQKELDMDMIELDDMFIKIKGRKTDKNFSMLPEEPVRAYAPADADATRLLFYKKIPQLLPTMRFLYGIEVELMKDLAHMEYYGLRLDIDQLLVWKEEAVNEKDRLQKEMFDYVGREFNPNSTKELPEIMYNELKYPVLFYTDKGAPSTGKYALKLLSNEKNKEGKHKYPLAKMLIDYKKQEKLINGFIHKMLTENIDGFIFPSYNQTGTDSGRISCSGPRQDWAAA